MTTQGISFFGGVDPETGATLTGTSTLGTEGLALTNAGSGTHRLVVDLTAAGNTGQSDDLSSAYLERDVVDGAPLTTSRDLQPGNREQRLTGGPIVGQRVLGERMSVAAVPVRSRWSRSR